jgi:hypothetical protein
VPSQLENDLVHNAHERLKRWTADTIMRCEVVEMSPPRTASMLYTCLTAELIELACSLGMKEQDFLIVMGEAYRSYKRMREAGIAGK